MNIADYIRDIQDFPKEGIGFKDITPLLNDHAAMVEATNQLLALVGDKKIDRVVGMESRGYFFATLLAEKLGAGFIPVRKPGKLPFDTISEAYGLEYGTDILEIHTDSIKPGEKVLIHDDVLATGGTAEAVCKLVERLGGEIVQVNFLMELSFLHGRDKLSNYDVKSLISY
ncbi:adenine phosphoribosyltransferase [Myroides odoratimimus]|uniref:Adenine phosphoribosyltransferase n=4 Tax=Myroides TaxID=76831 RepID=A0A0S7EBG6_9FLAO|nr:MULTISPECIES: adenine phosphoribosyltransferase [Myroides]AJA68264.1 adenine phosphoribosyltransferase [Myroides sp. A21]AJH16733.1 adenine phosphoribosyltransferase [Myroides profundi]ALU25562.1 adenine phosphoribosyltransferase [Myroides odoratimimus]APA91588.1 adenine phosphoribosyltransferase [Myroides sp. ZB35]EHO10888.1 adenine phosphoribosyltransferase [Myroides odoratimimus CCUG 10230]